MNDKKLATKIVALGVGRQDKGFHDYYWIPDLCGAVTVEEFVCEWRVAGALMEKCAGMTFKHFSKDHIFYATDGKHTVENESLPRAIIEAWVEALS